MKKTYNINISGYLFVIDSDAYDLLDDYLKTLQHAFAPQEDGCDLIADMELRIAEILTGLTDGGKKVVELQNVETVISQMGKPEEMIEDDIADFTTEKEGKTIHEEIREETIVPPPYNPQGSTQQPRKKLYRDMQDKIAGGVCSGLAAYVGMDATWMRLIFVVLGVFSFSTLVAVYIVLWIVVPEASTPLQQMQMRGESTTMENIGKTVTDFFKSNSSEGTPDMSAPKSTGHSFISFLVKCFFMVVIAIMCLVLFALTMVAAVCLLLPLHDAFATFVGVFGMDIPYWVKDANEDFFIPSMIFMAGFLITLIIPLFALIRLMFSSFSSRKNVKPLSKGWRNSLLITWIAGLLAAMITFGMIYGNKDKLDGSQHLFERIESHSR